MKRIALEMPNLGYDMTTGRVAAWTKSVGDSVRRGEVVAEIETDKATVEMESIAAGTLAEVVVERGIEVPVGTVIAYVEAPD